jgi:hypothetical protein
MKKPLDVRAQLIKAGVSNLVQFGYGHASADNILTDEIYRKFFRSMLTDNLGQGFDREINGLIAEIDAQGREGGLYGASPKVSS